MSPAPAGPPGRMLARASGFGGSIGLPVASRQLEGAKKSCPSTSRRTTTQRARFAPSGGATHAPATQRYRSPLHAQPPSAHTSALKLALAGRSGTISTGGGCGVTGTGT